MEVSRWNCKNRKFYCKLDKLMINPCVLQMENSIHYLDIKSIESKSPKEVSEELFFAQCRDSCCCCCNDCHIFSCHCLGQDKPDPAKLTA